VSKDRWYHLPKGEYPPQFLKALAMAVHRNVLDPSELDYWFSNNWSVREMTVEMYNRVKSYTGGGFDN
jgi:hypothetical protein